MLWSMEINLLLNLAAVVESLFCVVVAERGQQGAMADNSSTNGNSWTILAPEVKVCVL